MTQKATSPGVAFFLWRKPPKAERYADTFGDPPGRQKYRRTFRLPILFLFPVPVLAAAAFFHKKTRQLSPTGIKIKFNLGLAYQLALVTPGILPK